MDRRSVLRCCHRSRLRRLRARLLLPVLAATATLDQQRQKQRHMRPQHQKENVAKPFAAMILDLDISQRSARNLKWIKFFHNKTLPSL